jgi:hypothetical protein
MSEAQDRAAEDATFNQEPETDANIFKFDPAIQRAQLGMEAEVFKRSNLGRYLVGRSKMEVDRQMVALADMDDPDDLVESRKIRAKIAAAKEGMIWIQEVINSGALSAKQIDAEDEYDEGNSE